MNKVTTIVFFALLSGLAHAADPSTVVKLRRLELKTIDIKIAGQDKPFPFQYAQAIREVMLTSNPRGENADQLIKTMEVWEPMKKAIDSGAKELRLDQPSYDLVLQKINDMNWSPPQTTVEAVADFISYVRNLKEEDFDATPKTDPPKK